MAFHGLLVVRDEADILAETLTHLLTWADGVYILDTGSTDGTWEIVNDFGARDKRIVPMMSSPLYWHLGLRAMLFDRYRDRFRTGDWIIRLDADEMYHIPPPTFVREQVSRFEGRIRSLMFEFVLTRGMVEAERRTPRDVTQSIVERRRTYYLDPHAEMRLFKYRRSMRWTPDYEGPFNEGLIAYERIPIRHYRCRDEMQVRRRCALRSRMREGQPSAQTGHTFAAVTHWKEDNWEYWVWPDDQPRLRLWEPGTELPEFPSPRSSRWTRQRLASQAFYGLGLAGLADRRRPRFNGSYTPEAIPPELQNALRSIAARNEPPGRCGASS